MNASEKCRVSDCDRSAAASVVRDDLPGRLRLCATHTEDFRQDSVGWRIEWEREAPEPTSVITPAPAIVGRGAAIGAPSRIQAADHLPTESHPPLKSLRHLPRWAAHRIEARVAGRRKGRT
jgi:hypothetical protein